MPLTGHPLLEMRGIAKTFGSTKVLKQVDFSVTAGQVHALVGENGAGKSTLMKILAGVHRPDQGELLIKGEARHFANPGAALQAGIAMIYQELDLVEDLTVAENIYLGREPRGTFSFCVDRSSMMKQCQVLIDRYGLALQPEDHIRDLCVADCQLVEILKALSRQARLVVMDEPTSALSATEVQSLMGQIKQLKEEGIAIVYISHRLEEVRALADQITVLRDGKSVFKMSKQNYDERNLVKAMVGQPLHEYFPPPQKVTSSIPALTVSDLKSVNGLSDVSFKVNQGEVLGIAGLVGSGRTELARALFGLDPVLSGRIEIGDQHAQCRNPSAAIRSGLGYLTEDRKRSGLCLDLPSSWNVTLSSLPSIGMARLIKPAEENHQAQKHTQTLNIKWADPMALTSSLSGGNQQKLLVARWMMADAKILIFDEPTRGIDIGAKRDVYQQIRNMTAQGKAILFISSELDELFGMADRILVMHRLRAVACVDRQQSSAEEVMALMTVGQGAGAKP